MQTFVQDLRYAVRMMMTNRAFTAVAVFVLALGIGANSVIFSVVNGVLLRSSPYPDSDRIIMVYESSTQRRTREAVAAGNFLDWRDRNQVFENMTTYREGTFNLTGRGRTGRQGGGVDTCAPLPV